MIDAPLAIALAAGMVAAVNPCGFAMLPAYVSFFLGHEGEKAPSRRASVLRSIPIALTVSAGFVVVFGFVGIALRPLSSTIQEYAPWATIVIGLGLLALGISMLRGFELTARIPKLDRGGRTTGFGSMFLYGVSYAIASLSCTLPIFIAQIVNAFSRTNFVSGLATMVAYALGMGLVITTLTVAIALARDSVVNLLRSGMQYVNRVGGVLMVVMGAYVAWYGYVAIRVTGGDPGTAAGPVDTVERWSADATRFVHDIGATRLALSMVGAIAIMIGLSVAISSRSRA